jgi:hypothetical protein
MSRLRQTTTNNSSMLRNLQFYYYPKKRENVFLFANATALSCADNCGKHVYIPKKSL